MPSFESFNPQSGSTPGAKEPSVEKDATMILNARLPDAQKGRCPSPREAPALLTQLPLLL